MGANEYDSKYASYFKFLLKEANIDIDTWPYLYLAKRLFDKEYYAVNPMDGNRASDGLYLRNKFIESKKFMNAEGQPPQSDYVPEGPVRLLEMMVAFAIRIEDQVGDQRKGDRTAQWLNAMIDNLGLSKYKDKVFYKIAAFNEIDHILTDFIERNYDYSGYGGMWPLESPKTDQRNVELWYQFFEWFTERGYANEYLIK